MVDELKFKSRIPQTEQYRAACRGAAKCVRKGRKCEIYVLRVLFKKKEPNNSLSLI